MSDGRDVAKGAILTLAPTGLGFILSGWIVGVICLFIAGSLSLILWTPLGAWLGFHSDGDQREPAPLPPGDLARRPTHGDIAAMRAPVDSPSAPAMTLLSRDRPSKALQTIQAIFDEAKRRKLALIEAELVEMIDEGVRLRGDEFSGNPTLAEFDAWRGPIVDFVETVFGRTEKQRLLEVKWNGYEVRDHIAAVLDWLRALRDRPDSWQVKVDGPETEAAIKARRPPSLADQLDALMREGMKLLDELMAPAQAEETGEGVWALDFGDAPAEWWDKADAFYKRIRDLLATEHPALLPDFERGFNERLRIQRERETVAPRQPDSRSTAQKMLDFATETQRTPAKIVEACLEGLSQARKSI